MTEERLFEMLSNGTLRKVSSAGKTCKLSTVGSKIDIIMRIKSVALKDGKKFCNFFSKMWNHLGGWLLLSCLYRVV